jgi:F-type H+-transporting ATPase subunit a
MADPALHIKDAYYFEVPKFLWRYDFKSESEIPPSMQFLRKAHPASQISLADFNKDLSGKIIIPQYFATLKNLHEKEHGFAISKFMILELVVAIIVAVIFIRLAGKVSDGNAPKGRFANMFEAILVYLRDNVARPAIGGHDADKFVPLLWTLFFFVLVCNLMGMVPWAGSPTGSFGVTFGLACITFACVLVSGMLKFGPVGFWFNQVPHMELPFLLRPLKLLIFAIEVLGLCIKHFILSVRLLANMVAGHLVMLGIMGLIVIAAQASAAHWGLVTTISILGCTAFSCLELFVAFLQAYIFTFLSALFIGAAVHHH